VNGAVLRRVGAPLGDLDPVRAAPLADAGVTSYARCAACGRVRGRLVLVP
jgi:hypothetical protein